MDAPPSSDFDAPASDMDFLCQTLIPLRSDKESQMKRPCQMRITLNKMEKNQSPKRVWWTQVRET